MEGGARSDSLWLCWMLLSRELEIELFKGRLTLHESPALNTGGTRNKQVGTAQRSKKSESE